MHLKKLLRYLLIGSGCALVVTLLSQGTILFDDLEHSLADIMFRIRDDDPESFDTGMVFGNPRLDPGVIIVGIDEQTLETIGKWPFSRTVIARFVAHVASGMPELLFFDLLFTEAEREILDVEIRDGEIEVIEETDSQSDANLLHSFHEAVAAGVDIVIGYPLDEKKDAPPVEIAGLTNSLPVSGGESAAGLYDFNFAKPPLRQYQAAVSTHGYITMVADSDSAFRRVPLLARVRGTPVTHAVLQMAASYWGTAEVEYSGNRLRIGEGPVIPVNRRGQMRINFAGRPGEFVAQAQYLSFVDALRVDPAFFTGSCVLVGPYSQGLSHDVWQSPYGPMYGIEFNANALNTILTEDYLIEVSALGNILIILALAAVTAVISSYLKTWQSLVYLIIVVMFCAVGGYLLFLADRLILLAAPVLAVALAFAMTNTYKFVVEEREKRYVKKRFATYVSPRVVDELLQNPRLLDLGGSDRELTVFFSDIRGFTSLSEDFEPQPLIQLLNRYLAGMTNIIFENEGTLDKYIGDEIVAFWGAPIGQEDHALRACRTACLQMRFLRRDLNPAFEAEGLPSLNIGCGLNTGTVTVGNVGSETRMDYTVIGDDVNLGSRLQGANKEYGTNILMSEFTYARVAERVIAREIDTIRVMGRHEPVLIYELLAIEGEDTVY